MTSESDKGPPEEEICQLFIQSGRKYAPNMKFLKRGTWGSEGQPCFGEGTLMTSVVDSNEMVYDSNERVYDSNESL